MKKRLTQLLFAISLLQITQGAMAQDSKSQPQMEQSQEKVIFSRVKVYCNSQQAIELQRAGVDLDHLNEKTNTYLVGEFSSYDLASIQRLGLDNEVLISDMATYYRERNLKDKKENKVRTTNATPFGFNYGSMGGFFTMQEMEQELDSLFMQYPNLITQKVSIGNSLQGNPIWMVKISDNPNVDENEPEALYTGAHHCREVITVTELIYIMQYMLQNYGTDPNITYLLQNRELYFVPLVNPDGYLYNEFTDPAGGGMWRKNRRDNGDGSFGIDLNRNYGFQWGYDDQGSSPDGFSDMFRGTTPFSEPETQAMRAFCQSRQFKTANNTHSFGRLLLHPWGYVPTPCPDNSLFQLRGGLMTQENFYTYGQAPLVLYSVNGEANDWMYGEQTEKPKIMSFTSETGDGNDGFWPIESRIIPLCEEMQKMLLDNAWLAGEYLLTAPQTFFSTPSLSTSFPATTTNYGQETANNVTLSIVSNSPYITSSGTTLINGLAPAGNVLKTIPITLANNTPHNQLINAVVRTTFSDGYYLDSAFTFTFTGFPTSISQPSTFNQSFLYPNPTNQTAKVQLGQSVATPVWVEIFDIQGKKIQTLSIHNQEVELKGINTGMYFYRFVTEKETGELQKLWIQQ